MRNKFEAIVRLVKKITDFSTREDFLKIFPKHSVGAEIGVFKGEFSVLIAQIVQPKKLHLIDVWWKLFGEHYPDWGDYTDFGKLKTKDAFDNAKNLLAGFDGVSFHVDNSIDCLNSFENNYFDWVYLDSSHSYEDTHRELEVLRSKVKKDGLIAGHDWQPDPSHRHHGVFKAINEFMKKHNYELVKIDSHFQWCIRKAKND